MSTAVTEPVLSVAEGRSRSGGYAYAINLWCRQAVADKSLFKKL